MKKLDFIMGMPIQIEIVGEENDSPFEKVFKYLRWVDEVFSPYKQNSEVTLLNDGRNKKISKDMMQVLELCQKTKKDSNGYFDPYNNGSFDPSGLVKGWAIYEASKILKKMKYKNFFVEGSGDIQTYGLNEDGKKWAIGIKNPFKTNEIVKVVYLSGEGIATSGTYEKGKHIYNPNGQISDEVTSVTVISKNVYEADRFSTPAFAMGRKGVNFLERQKVLEGYMIDKDGIATMTSGFEKYTHA